MKYMTLENITAACGGTYNGDPAQKQATVNSVIIDSRKTVSGDLFIPLKGARADGHDFIPQVYDMGALCCLSEQPLPGETRPYILVESCAQALKDIAAFYRSALDTTVIGITGSVGKTSTKEMIASILSEKYNVLKTEGNFNNEIGLPLTIFRLKPEHEIAVLEMGISDFGEMHRLAKTARPDLCVMTNIGPCHLENLGDLNGVLKAKSEIFDFIKPESSVFLNGDDPTLHTVESVKGITPVFFGINESGLSVTASSIESHGLEGTSCILNLQSGDTVKAFIPIPGDHMVYNALAGAAVASVLDLTPEQIEAGIAKLKPVAGRNRQLDTGYLKIIDDCYNANPVSMKAALSTLSTSASKTTAILGDMFELGEESENLHYNVGVFAKECGIDKIICIGELAKAIADGASDSNSAVHRFATKAEFLSQADQLLNKGDTVLVKASHGMVFEELVDYLQKLN